MSTIQENLNRITNAKSAIKDAIIQKGIEVTDAEKIETYADKILQIKSGGGAEIPEFDHEGPLTIYCFDDWGDAYVKFDNGYQESTIQYSTDGSTWGTYTDEKVKLTKGQYVQFKGVITQYAPYGHYSTFILKGGLFNLYGNLTSLDNYISTFDGGNKYNFMFKNTNVYDCSKLNTGIKTINSGSVFSYMFNNCKYLVKVPELPVTTLANYCYQNMFYGCTSLTTIPSNLLPATTLAEYCYDSMFSGCTGLTTIPSDLLPATTLASYCYGNMFDGCTGLTTIPSNLLPATTLTWECYKSMFSGCTGLTTIPDLPATTLTYDCYENMFDGCSSLVETPEGWYLPAQTTNGNSCSSMFANCYRLHKMAVSYSGTITADHWRNFLDNVSWAGTFYYSKNQTEENIRSIVPEGWTLVQSTEW